MIFGCEVCDAKFDDPCEDAGGGETCGEHHIKLAAAGWREVWIKVSMLDNRRGKKDRHVLSRGGWMCPLCVATYDVHRKAK